MQPFLKWPGGKRWLISAYESIIPKSFTCYYEPFLGSGAMFFFLEPQKAVLSDINQELVTLYEVMKDSPEELSGALFYHQSQHSSDYYYKKRTENPCEKIGKASRTLYLNRTCFNGMYRVNKQGVFNVPIGTKTNITYDTDSFKEYSTLLKRAEIRMCDFSETIDRASKGDFIFADPPYTTNTNNSSVKYNSHLFSWEDQKRLCSSLTDAKKRGVKVLLTNAYSEDIIEMYKAADFYIEEIQRRSTISGLNKGRKSISELIITC